MCRCYKRLDKCEHQIAPHEMKYQLHNTDNRTLFHCNCTRRSVSKLKCVPSPGPLNEHCLGLGRAPGGWQGFHLPSRGTNRCFGVERGGTQCDAHSSQQLLTATYLCP